MDVPGGTQMPTSLAEVYVLDVVLALVLSVLVVFALCGAVRMAHIGGRVMYRVGSFSGRAAYAFIDFFSKLYQAALGIIVTTVILGALYFYLTTHEQRQSVHSTLERSSPVTSGIIKQVVEHEATQKAKEHLRALAGTYLSFQ